MPDITMCANTKCPQRVTCYRHKAIPSSRQSWAGFQPNDDGTCDHWISVHGKDTTPLTKQEKQELLDSLAGALI